MFVNGETIESKTNVDAATKVEKPHHDWLRGRQKNARIITATNKSVK